MHIEGFPKIGGTVKKNCSRVGPILGSHLFDQCTILLLQVPEKKSRQDLPARKDELGGLRRSVEE